MALASLTVLGFLKGLAIATHVGHGWFDWDFELAFGRHNEFPEGWTWLLSTSSWILTALPIVVVLAS